MSVTLRSFMQRLYDLTSGKNSVDIGMVFCYALAVEFANNRRAVTKTTQLFNLLIP